MAEGFFMLYHHARAMLTRRVRVFTHPMLARAFHRWMLVAACALLAGAWIAALAVPRLSGDAELVTHYTTTFGVDELGGWTQLVRLPITGTVLVALNIALARALTPKGTDAPTGAATALVVASALLAFVALVGTVLLWRMNGAQ